MPADWSINDENHFPFAVWRVIGGAAQSNQDSLAAFNLWAITVAGCNIHIWSSYDKRRGINASQEEMNDNGGSESYTKWVYRAHYCADAAFLKAVVYETGYSPQIRSSLMMQTLLQNI